MGFEQEKSHFFNDCHGVPCGFPPSFCGQKLQDAVAQLYQVEAVDYAGRRESVRLQIRLLKYGLWFIDL